MPKKRHPGIPEGLRVLIAEDEEMFRTKLTELLRTEGCEVTAVQDGQEARNVFSLSHFDLVISDISMPGVDGHELLNFIKKESSAKVILMTGYSYREAPDQPSEAVPDLLLLKPFGSEDLREAIARAIATSSRPRLKLLPTEIQPAPPLQDLDSSSVIGLDLFIDTGDGFYELLCSSTEPLPVKKVGALLRLGVPIWVRRVS
jgi:two-component system, cell cycle response regulator CpdR